MNIKKYALYCLNKQDYTVKNFKKKLENKKFIEEDINKIICEFIKKKWLNDDRYVENFILNNIKYKKKVRNI